MDAHNAMAVSLSLVEIFGWQRAVLWLDGFAFAMTANHGHVNARGNYTDADAVTMAGSA
jgi:hypothetical protein